MLKFIVKRLILLVPTLLGVVTLVFFMIALSPGDPARVMLGERASAEQLEKLRAELGLDKPPGQQFLIYLGRVVRGDLGKSIVTQRPVTGELRDLLPATIELAVTATAFASAAGIVMGVAAARKAELLGGLFHHHRGPDGGLDAGVLAGSGSYYGFLGGS